MKKLFTLLTLLVCVCTGAWANQSGLIENVTLPDMPNSSLDLSSQTTYTPDANGWIVFDPYEETNSSVPTWWSHTSRSGQAPGAAFTYGETISTTAPFTTRTNTDGFKTNTGNTASFRFTGAEKVSFLVHPRSNSAGKKLAVSLFTYNNTQTLVSTQVTNANAYHELLFEGLSSSNTYVAYIYKAYDPNASTATQNGSLVEIALKAKVATYKVTYKANGGTGDDVVDDATSSVANNPFTYEGHTFTGWNTAADGKGTSYAAGAAVTSNLTLFAQWMETPNYTLAYNANGGTGSMDETEGYGSINLSPIAYTKSGYSFMGWATSQANADAGTVAYSDKGSYSLTADATLYAVWIANDYSFTASQGSGTISSDEEVTTSIGGKMVYTPDEGGSPTLKYSTTAGTNCVEFGGGAQCNVTVTLDKLMQAGTVISLTFYNSNESARGLKIANSEGTAKATYSETAIGTHTKQYTVVAGDGLEGSNVFKIARNNNSYLVGLTVVKCVTAYDITHSAADNGTYTIKVGAAEAVSTNTIAAEGATISLAATPDPGYQLAGWSVTKTGSGDAVAVSNNSFTMPAAAVTIAPIFERGVVLTWNIQVNKEETKVTTSSATSSYTTYIANPDNLTVTDLNVTSSPKETATNKIQSTTDKDANKYISATFTVQDGYSFIPTSMEVAVTAVTEDKTIQVYVGDDNQTYTQSTNNSPENHTYTFTNAKEYKGTVTMKIYAYGGESGYRLGTPIRIYGKIMPIPVNPVPGDEETYLTTTNNMAGWRAFYDADNSYSVDENTKVYVVASNPEGTKVSLTIIDGVPAGVPVILHTSSTADNHKMTLTKETASPYSYTGENKLQYTTSAVNDVYRLGYGADGVGFYPYSGTPASGAVILNVNTQSAKALMISFGDETALDNVSAEEKVSKGNGKRYNLAGQLVGEGYKGIVIENGKKFNQ